MIWSQGELTANIKSNVVMGFNEPDLAGQSNMSPVIAAVLWKTIEKWYPDRILISPAPSQINPDWLWKMVEAYHELYGGSPRFDGIAIHYYRWNYNMPTLMDYLSRRRADEIAHGYNAPIWITEFGACGINEVDEFRRDATYIETTDWIEKAAWYKLRPDSYDLATCSSLLDQYGNLTPLGEVYLEHVAPQP